MKDVCRTLAFFSLLVAVSGCSTTGTTASRSTIDQNLITLAEIEATEARDAYEVIQQLRPRWMNRNRGQRSINEGQSDYARVVLDDLPPREFDSLREIPREAIFEIRFLDAREATFLYGTGYNAGVVKVTTKR